MPAVLVPYWLPVALVALGYVLGHLDAMFNAWRRERREDR